MASAQHTDVPPSRLHHLSAIFERNYQQITRYPLRIHPVHAAEFTGYKRFGKLVGSQLL